MYVYLPAYKTEDLKVIIQVIRQNPFATTVTTEQHRPYANHVPLLYKKSEKGLGFIEGHMQKDNTQLKHFEDEQEALFIFHGPDAYVPPEADSDPKAVPTWNFITVHAYGKVTLLPQEKLIQLLERSVKFFGQDDKNPWAFSPKDKHLSSLVSQIVGFRMVVERFETQFKLNQDRSKKRRQAIKSYLVDSTSDKTKNLGKWMDEMALKRS